MPSRRSDKRTARKASLLRRRAKKPRPRPGKRRPATSKPSPRRAQTPATRPAKPAVAAAGNLTVTEFEELDGLRREMERAAGRSSPLRWNANPDDVQRSVAQLVLTLIEFIRRLLERQAIRRMDAGTLTDPEIENIGRALMKLEQTVREMAARFGIAPEDLNLDLGPVGKLM
jgi:hypothetical protein